MRYFTGNYKSFINNVLTECFNMEAGKIYCKDNTIIDYTNSNTKPELYPSFNLNGVLTTIKSVIGIVYVPNHLIEQLTTDLMAGLNKLSNEFNVIYGFSHLNEYTALETCNNHFVVLKAKTDIEKNPNIRHITTDNNLLNSFYYYNRAKFVWVIQSINILLKDIFYYNNKTIGVQYLLLSIVYDPANIFNFKNNTLYNKNLTYKNIKFCNNITHLTTFGNITKEFVDEFVANIDPKYIKSLIKKKVPRKQRKNKKATNQNNLETLPDAENNQEGEVTELNQPSLTPEISEETPLETPPLETQLEVSDNVKYKNSYFLYTQQNFIIPEFVNGWNNENERIKLCPVRKGGIELIKQISGYNVTTDYYLTIEIINTPIYEVNYNKINVIPTDNGKTDVCYKCNTPLYDYVYGLFATIESTYCKLYCAICMHSKHFGDNPDKLYNETSIIAKILYPYKLKQVLNSLEINSDIKKILTLSFSNYCFYGRCKQSDYFILTDIKTNTGYIGWGSDLYSLVDFKINLSLNQDSNLNNELMHIFNTYKIFSCSIVNPFN